MKEDEFTKLFKYTESFRRDVSKGFDDARKDRDDIRGALAELGGQLKDIKVELIMTNRQLDRLERSVLKIARETGIEVEI